ncbi:hypothetical protein [Dokdonella immobilis]|uniref:Uncharacterized protein n=1 Tax=Dokdonella immobilis TaxID=578942 RepID=A0A1I4VZJ4_9GAMM|nr:hypothetical protein [Dokdonella immobilis]SFN06416.1 hypothetical protein SAMN05216289_103189 [Dokdonella immobilis]
MQDNRRTEANILGYQLDRVEGASQWATRYEVLGPEDNNVIASFPDRPSAERFILLRELRGCAPGIRNPAY